MSNLQINYKQLVDNKISMINVIKLLLYKENSVIFEKLNFDDDNIFLNPLLFAYFNKKNSSEMYPAILVEALQGYFNEKASVELKFSFNQNSIAYVPEVGYFNRLSEKVEDLLIIDNFEVIKECHYILEDYFVEFYKGHIINPKPSHNSAWQSNYDDLRKAIIIIKEHLPNYYKELIFSNKKIYLHDNPKVLNFTSIETLGMLYFYVVGKYNLIYFIEELIHQGSHNFLYYLLHNRAEYFKINVDNTIMRDLTMQDWDYRNVYGAFHGLFTVTQRVICFDILISKNIFSGRKKHELLGRMTDMIPRFKTGLDLLDLDLVYTERGKQFYFELTKSCENILNKYMVLKKEFNLNHQDLDFRYDEFCKLNSYEDFTEKDSNNHYNF